MNIAFNRCAALMVVFAGAAGQFLDCYAADTVADVCLHTLFGPMLCAAIVLRFGLLGRVAVASKPAIGISTTGYWLVRRTSREIYLFLFLLFALRQLFNLGASLWWRVPLTHEINSLYFIGGLCGLMTIRLAAAATAAIAVISASPDRLADSSGSATAALTRLLARTSTS